MVEGSSSENCPVANSGMNSLETSDFPTSVIYFSVMQQPMPGVGSFTFEVSLSHTVKVRIH
jgi:hypothetical protein